MIKSLAVRSDSLFVPAIALTTIVVNGIFANQMPSIVYWLISVTMFVVLLSWHRSLRITYSESYDSAMNSEEMVVVRPYAITFGILYAGLLGGLVCVTYFGLGFPYFIACLVAWFIRRDVWLALLLRGLNRSRQE